MLLDVVRFSAALVVVVGHLTFAELKTGLPDLHVIGEYAVPVFFVLSGFVIRFVTRSREHSLRVFLIDRASRMYSVMIPAMAITLAISAVCFAMDRQHYLSQWGAVSDHILVRVLFNLIFVSQSWGHNTIPLIDAPFWSLIYECLYYLAYGFIFFLRGWRRTLALVVWAILAGPQVLFLFPIWWLGCWIYDLYHHLRTQPVARIAGSITGLYLSAGVILLAARRPLLFTAPFTIIHRAARLPEPLPLLHIASVRATLSAFTTGLLAGVAMLLLLFLSTLIVIPRRSAWARRFRRVADGTFSIYLMHYPLLVLALFLGLLQPGRYVRDTAVAGAICAALILTAVPLDRLKNAMRDWLGRHFPDSRADHVSSEAG